MERSLCLQPQSIPAQPSPAPPASRSFRPTCGLCGAHYSQRQTPKVPRPQDREVAAILHLHPPLNQKINFCSALLLSSIPLSILAASCFATEQRALEPSPKLAALPFASHPASTPRLTKACAAVLAAPIQSKALLRSHNNPPSLNFLHFKGISLRAATCKAQQRNSHPPPDLS
jgi:hypothetical protein